jgi:hypothetical protein
VNNGISKKFESLSAKQDSIHYLFSTELWLNTLITIPSVMWLLRNKLLTEIDCYSNSKSRSSEMQYRETSCGYGDGAGTINHPGGRCRSFWGVTCFYLRHLLNEMRTFIVFDERVVGEGDHCQFMALVRTTAILRNRRWIELSNGTNDLFPFRFGAGLRV